MALVYLLSLPSVFVYFLNITLSSLKKATNEEKVNHQNDVICFEKTYNKWVLFVGLIITATATGIFYALRAGNAKPPKASLDATDIMKLAGWIVGGALVKDYVAYKNGSTSNATKFYGPLKGQENYMTSFYFAGLWTQAKGKDVLTHTHL